MIVDFGAPYSLVGEGWLKRYADENGLVLDDLEKEKKVRHFKFGPGEIYRSEERWFVPVVIKREDDTEEYKKIGVQVIDDSVPMIIGMDTIKKMECKFTIG